MTGPARRLLISVEDGVRVVAVEGSETFAGMHEVIDLTLDLEPHNFVAAGVVVHNKSPAADGVSAEEAGPTVELGPGDASVFFYPGEVEVDTVDITIEPAPDIGE